MRKASINFMLPEFRTLLTINNVKMHIDDGLEIINNEITENPNLDGFDYIIDKIDDGLKSITNTADNNESGI